MNISEIALEILFESLPYNALKAISFVDGEICLIELMILGYASNSIFIELLFLEEILALDGSSILKSEGAADAK